MKSKHPNSKILLKNKKKLSESIVIRMIGKLKMMVMQLLPNHNQKSIIRI